MLLLVAWDGAGADLAAPLMEAGEMPVLSSLIESGGRIPVRSTWPPVTFPAWTSFMTAASPGRHGVVDFTVRSGYDLRFVNSSFRRMPTIWSMLGAAGKRVGIYGLPATYPPEAIDGVQIPGFDTPLGAGTGNRLSHPPDLAARLRARYGRLAIEGVPQSRIDDAWHRRALAAMLDEIELRTRIVTDLLEEEPFDVFLVHFSESDTVCHQFWQRCDPASPRYTRPAPGDETTADAIRSVYRALDASLARLLESAGPGATTMVVSDHGSGGTADRVILWNRWLADQGLLAFGSGLGLARGLKRAALSVVPQAVQPAVFRALPGLGARLEARSRLGGIDWGRTVAFSEELPYYPSIWLNLRGREPQGTVEPADADAVCADIESRLVELTDPFDGERVVTRVHRREELFDGPHAGRAPDLIVELREPDGYSYAAMSSRGGRETRPIRKLRDSEMTGERGTSMAGSHRFEGLCVVSGPGVVPSRRPTGADEHASMADAGATVLALAGLDVPAGADGRAWAVADDAGRAAPAAGPTLAAETAYDEDAEREVAERLRALGYLD